MDFKTRRVAAFRKNLVDLAELELKHAKVRIAIHPSGVCVLRDIISTL